MGCAFAISVALIIGQGLIMNIYYNRKQNINIRQFWIEICKMSIIPVFLAISGLLLLRFIVISSWFDLIVGVVIFTIIYAPLFWHFSMSRYEKDLVNSLMKSLSRKE